MRKTIAVSICLAMSIGPVAQAEPLAWAGDHEPRVMLYFQKPVGWGDSKEGVARFGLSLERSFHGSVQGALAPELTMPILDLRLSSSGTRSVLLGGGLMWDSTNSIDEESWGNPWLYLGGAALLAALMCIAEEVLCEDSGGGADGYEIPD